jgi:hypothetical protein
LYDDVAGLFGEDNVFIKAENSVF